VAIATPLGVWLEHMHRVSFLTVDVGNIGRALPGVLGTAICVAALAQGVLALTDRRWRHWLRVGRRKGAWLSVAATVRVPEAIAY
jgi:hypothetical protein